ncbi:MAG: hypothetical protein HO274_12230 [Ferrovum myxofaciens]|uniref:hypothetical protein n=1 Tax=Ferrovum myxofaciens TaxID=416213 RepID=UPI0023550FC4|nr:hypothetical protein [Ferrovum myxofaciens]QKE41980.1 MAG: hypothetical protein HO274_12230 [Ferrovum myxofaciens]
MRNPDLTQLREAVRAEIVQAFKAVGFARPRDIARQVCATHPEIISAATIVFPAATAGSETETFWGIGVAATGVGTLLYSGAITPGIVVSNGVTPELTTSSTATES